MNEDGFLRIVDRAKDKIQACGANLVLALRDP